MLRIVKHTVPRVGRSYENFPNVFELYRLHSLTPPGSPNKIENIPPLFHAGKLSRITHPPFVRQIFEDYMTLRPMHQARGAAHVTFVQVI